MNRFLTNFPDQQAIDMWQETWGQGLAGINAEQMRYGLDLMQKRHTDWPPALPEFRECCIAWPKPASKPLPALPRANSSHQQQCMAQIRELFTKQRKPGRWWAKEVLSMAVDGKHVSVAAMDLARAALERESA